MDEGSTPHPWPLSTHLTPPHIFQLRRLGRAESADSGPLHQSDGPVQRKICAEHGWWVNNVLSPTNRDSLLHKPMHFTTSVAWSEFWKLAAVPFGVLHLLLFLLRPALSSINMYQPSKRGHPLSASVPGFVQEELHQVLVTVVGCLCGHAMRNIEERWDQTFFSGLM